ncbi:hypothetical protein [Vibrio harveyi]|uniref:hypothetical protein n=1 Tax=Vibrio harveyi TaxID=669 RepID=UPI000D78611E|nr:hypothetical protein [Vibrio harveyi]HDM8062793.1 hypothetical protein [Vibrio harveyi]
MHESIQSLKEPVERQKELTALLLYSLLSDDSIRNREHSGRYQAHWGSMLDGVELAPATYHREWSQYDWNSIGEGISIEGESYHDIIVNLIGSIFFENPLLQLYSGISPEIHVNVAASKQQVYIYVSDEQYEIKSDERVGYIVRLNHRGDKVVEHGILADEDA